MRKILTVLVFSTAAAFLTACNQSSAPSPAAAPASSAAPAAAHGQSGDQSPAASNQTPKTDKVQQKLVELAGGSATNCGRIGMSGDMMSASNCAMQASQAKRPFYVAYEMPGLVVGIAGAHDGKLYTVQAMQPEPGQPAAQSGGEISSGPCPAALRVAQSGRVTCMSPAAMGQAGNPHGGAVMPGESNPHGGMMAAPPGTPNPHGKVPTKPGTVNPHGDKIPPKTPSTT